MTNDRTLLAFALGSFHAVLLTMLLLIGLYLLVDFGDALEDASTALGLGIFAALWASSVYCTDRAIHASGMEPGLPVSASRILHAGETWGAWNGIIFFWCLLVVGIFLIALESTPEQVVSVILFSPMVLIIGSAVAAVVGVALGFATALLELALLKAAHSLVPAEAE